MYFCNFCYLFLQITIGFCSLFADLGFVPPLLTAFTNSTDSLPVVLLPMCSSFTVFARRELLLYISMISSVIFALILMVEMFLPFTKYFLLYRESFFSELDSSHSSPLLLCLKRTHQFTQRNFAQVPGFLKRGNLRFKPLCKSHKKFLYNLFAFKFFTKKSQIINNQ